MLSGKGFFIWQAKRCEGGNPETIADLARLAGLSHVLIKIADGPYQYNVSVDLPGIVIALRAAGIQVWGWQYVYGNQPAAEADKAIERVHTLGLEGFVIDAEGEYKRPDMAAAADIYTTRLRRALPNLPIALSSYRFPTLHPQLPWAQFRQICDYDMPQVYWMQAHNAGAQLRRCVDEFSRLSPRLPLVPTGAAFREHGWQATAGEVVEFMEAAHELGLSAFNFWEWYDAR